MKKLWVRETLYLLLPVLLIGGGVLLKNGDYLKWSRPADPGPARVEIVGFKPLKLTPLDVAQGLSWGTVVQTKVLGDAKLPEDWKQNGKIIESDLSFVYRQGKSWKRVPWSKSGANYVFTKGRGEEHTLRVDLNHVPKDADEVRLRGYLELSQYFSGKLPKGWSPPKNLSLGGAYPKLILRSKPVDIVVKAVGKTLAIPQVSHQQKVKLIDSRWYTTHYSKGVEEEFFLHLRHSENKNWSSEANVTVDNLKFLDANGKEIPIYSDKGRGFLSYGRYTYQNFNFSLLRSRPDNQERFSPNKPESDLIVPLLSPSDEPRQTWSRYKQPIRVEAEVSDGNCWPTKVKGTFSHGDIRYNDGTYDDIKKLGEPVR